MGISATAFILSPITMTLFALSNRLLLLSTDNDLRMRLKSFTRDIKYIHHMNAFVLALEETGSIGLLKVN